MTAVDYDLKEADKIAKKEIYMRLSDFKNNPETIIPFFGEKTVTQWCEPSFQVFWMPTAQKNHGKLSKTGKSLLYGKLSDILQIYMRFFILLVYLGNIFYYVVNARRKKFNLLFICGITVIGGFLFHMIWEAKALYIMPYMIFSIPCGVIGLTYCFDYTYNFLGEEH